MWDSCYPITIDLGEHPTININLGHFNILRANWDPNAIIYSECISSVVNYLCEAMKPKIRCVNEVLLLHSE